MEVTYGRESSISIDEYINVLQKSGLAARRPVTDVDRVRRMLENSNLIVSARCASVLVGVSRSLSDFAYCCYLSDLAVDREFQGRGIGKTLIEETRRLAGPESMCLLLSAPDSMGFYKAIGMPQPANAFLFPRER